MSFFSRFKKAVLAGCTAFSKELKSPPKPPLFPGDVPGLPNNGGDYLISPDKINHALIPWTPGIFAVKPTVPGKDIKSVYIIQIKVGKEWIYLPPHQYILLKQVDGVFKCGINLGLMQISITWDPINDRITTGGNGWDDVIIAYHD